MAITPESTKALIESTPWPWQVEVNEQLVTTHFETAFRRFEMVVDTEEIERQAGKEFCLLVMVLNIARINGATGTEALKFLLNQNFRYRFASFGISDLGEVTCSVSIPRPAADGEFSGRDVECFMKIAAHAVSETYPRLMAAVFGKGLAESKPKGRVRK